MQLPVETMIEHGTWISALALFVCVLICVVGVTINYLCSNAEKEELVKGTLTEQFNKSYSNGQKLEKKKSWTVFGCRHCR
jgi:hypothetical protein